MKDLQKFLTAVAFATAAHGNQRRNDGSAYILHPIRVVSLLHEFGCEDTDTLCAAVLHDVVEDCSDGKPAEMAAVIGKCFGDSVCTAVSMLSKNMALSGADGKVDLHKYFQRIASAWLSVRLVKVADRIDNVADMRGWKEERVRRYLQETETYVIPIAESTNVRMAARLKALVERQKSSLHY